MHPDLRKRRAFLIQASARFERAEADWRAAVEAAAELVPSAHVHSHWSIGNPGSRIRSLYDQRDRALQRLTVAVIKFEAARDRLRQRQAEAARRQIRFLSYRQHSF